MLTINRLFIFPVKSLGGVEVAEAEVTDRGLAHDRRWMLIDEQNCFLSQRSHPQMAYFDIRAEATGFMVTYRPDGSSWLLPYHPQPGPVVRVSVWDDQCDACLMSNEADQWFSAKLKFGCRLVYMPDDSLRPVDGRYAAEETPVSFADAYPILLIGQASMDKLNEQLVDEVPVSRFRPNIVFTGAGAHFEDCMAHFAVNGIEFFGVKPCARCVMIGIDQQTTQTHKEPMKTLTRYRTRNKKVFFGQNLLIKGRGKIRVGDALHIMRLKPDFMQAPGHVPLYEQI